MNMPKKKKQNAALASLFALALLAAGCAETISAAPLDSSRAR